MDIFKPKPEKPHQKAESLDDVEKMHDVIIDKDYKKFLEEHPNGKSINYPLDKIISKEIVEFIEDEGKLNLCGKNAFISANAEYENSIESTDYCVYIGGWVDDKGLWMATNKSTIAQPGTIIFDEVPSAGYDYSDRIFAKSFNQLLRNSVKED